MSQTVVQIPPSITLSYPVTTDTAPSSRNRITHIESSYPVRVMEDRVRIFGDLIVPNTYYPFESKGKKYLLFRPKAKVTEIYEVVE